MGLLIVAGLLLVVASVVSQVSCWVQIRRSRNNSPRVVPRYYTTNDLCDIFKRDRKTIPRWRAKNLIAYMKINGRILYPSSDVDRFAAAHTVPAVY